MIPQVCGGARLEVGDRRGWGASPIPRWPLVELRVKSAKHLNEVGCHGFRRGVRPWSLQGLTGRCEKLKGGPVFPRGSLWCSQCRRGLGVAPPRGGSQRLASQLPAGRPDARRAGHGVAAQSRPRARTRASAAWRSRRRRMLRERQPAAWPARCVAADQRPSRAGRGRLGCAGATCRSRHLAMRRPNRCPSRLQSALAARCARCVFRHCSGSHCGRPPRSHG